MFDKIRASIPSTVNLDAASSTSNVGRARFGGHGVTLGQSSPASPTPLADRAKAFFSSIPDKFQTLVQSAKERVAELRESWQEYRAEARLKSQVARWDRSTLAPPKISGPDTCLSSMATAEAAQSKGAEGRHGVAKAFVAYCKGQVGKSGDGAQSWQDVARSGMKVELLKAKNFETAKSQIDKLVQDFAIYADTGTHSELTELAEIAASLKHEVTDKTAVDTFAREAFSAEIDEQLGNTKNFFRGNTSATAGYASIIRNTNGDASARLIETFTDVLTDPTNKADIDAFQALGSPERKQAAGPNKVVPTRDEIKALNRLTDRFFERAFGIGKDDGAAFIASFDPTAKSFILDTCNEIAGRSQFGADTRNDGIRKWFSNGVALRDFGAVAVPAARAIQLDTVGLQLATNILRVVAGVQGQENPVDEGETERKAFFQQIAPKIDAFLQNFGMPVVQ